MVKRNLWCPTRFFDGTIIRLIIYINDLPGVISKDSSVALYADDSKMHRIIDTQEDLSSFQSDLDKISAWCKMNKMTINTKKDHANNQEKVTLSRGV